jgi:hypothetical protein
VESGGSVGKLKGNEQPLFRGESAGFVNLPLCQHVAKLTGTSRSIPSERRRCGYRLRFHGTILHGNDTPVPLKRVTIAETLCHDGNSFAADLILLRHTWNGKDSRYIFHFPSLFVFILQQVKRRSNLERLARHLICDCRKNSVGSHGIRLVESDSETSVRQQELALKRRICPHWA